MQTTLEQKVPDSSRTESEHQKDSVLNKILEDSQSLSPLSETGKEYPKIHQIQGYFRGRVKQVLNTFNPLHKLGKLTSPFSKSIKFFGEKVGKIMNWFSEKAPEETSASSHETNISEVSQESPAEELFPHTSSKSAEAYKRAEEAEIEHQEILLEEFKSLHDSYREQLAHEHPKLKMSSPRLRMNDDLMKLAKSTATQQANQGFLEHNEEGYRKKHSIDGEILLKGFRTAREALEDFLNSPEHHKTLTGDFSQYGFAIRSGIEQSSGKKMYFLVVLYRNGKAQDQAPPRVGIPGGSVPEKLQAQTIEQAIGKRHHLKAAFDALDLELQEKPELSYELNQKVTEKMQEKNELRGVFCITLRKGETYQQYTVQSNPPLLMRSEMVGDKGKVFQVEFKDLLQDFEKMTAEPEMTAEELQDANDPEVTEPEQRLAGNSEQKQSD